MIKIDEVFAEEIFDSRGMPTLAVTVRAGGYAGTFAVPSGASTGSHEALELRDGNPLRYGGKGVTKAIEHVRSLIAPRIIGMDAGDQRAVDAALCALDGTANKSRLGANAILGVSIAVAKAAASSRGLELFAYLRTLAIIAPSRPVPLLFMNLINGGKHANTRLAFQEYHVVPVTDDIDEAIRIGKAMQDELLRVISEEGKIPSIGDEGGYALDTEDVAAPLACLAQAAERLGVTERVRFALDIAATSLYDGARYAAGGSMLSPDELFNLYSGLIARFPLISIEDPFAEESFEDFTRLAAAHPELKIVGDDLTVTNKDRVARAIAEKSITTLLVKPNQIGTLSETLEVMRIARQAGIDLIVSHRSGETMDDFIADLAFAFGCYGLKAGAPEKTERKVKYERLAHICK